MKRLAGIVMAIVMALSMCYIEVGAATADITMSWDSATGTLILSGNGDMPDYELGNQPWYQYKDEVEKVIIEDGITSICETAFYEFYYIKSLEVAGTVKRIDAAAFADCMSLTEITLEEGLETLGEYVFQSVPAITITLPASLKEMDAPSAFFNTNFKSINISASNANYSVQNNIIYNKNKTELLFYPKTIKDTEFAVPSTVKKIGSSAMRDNVYLESITLPSSVTELGDWCFYGNISLESFVIPNTVKAIGDGILEECTSLKSVSIESVIKSTSYRMFSGCTSLEKVHFAEGLEEFYLRTFYDCTALKEVNFPKSLKAIRVYAFYNCDSLGQIALPNGIEEIDAGAFEECDKINYKVPDGLVEFEDGGFVRAYTVKVSGTYDYTKAYKVLELVNEERAKEGLSPLAMDKDLLEAAMKRSAEISFLFEHDRPNGTSCFTISDKVMGENIAAGSSTAARVMENWMNSPGHRANILTGDYVSIGVGCFEMNGTLYWVQLFGWDDADTLTKPSNRDVTETITIKKELANFESVTDLPKSLAVGKSVKIELRTINQGWSYIYCRVDSDSFDWSSSNKAVATVGSKGKVTAVSAGKAVITAKYKGTSEVAFTWTVKCTGDSKVVSVVNGKVPKAKIKTIKKTGKKKVKVTLKKINGVNGYQIKYSTGKKFKKSKTKTKVTKKVTVKIGKLKKGKKYYFKARAYVLNAKGKKDYGKWSKVKKVKRI